MAATNWHFEGNDARRHIGFAKSKLRVFRRSGRPTNQWFNVAGARIRIAITTSGLEEVWIFADDIHVLYDKNMHLGVAIRLPLDVSSLFNHPAVSLTTDPERPYTVSEDIEVLRYLTRVSGNQAKFDRLIVRAGNYTTEQMNELADLPGFDDGHPAKLSWPQIFTPGALSSQMRTFIAEPNPNAAYILWQRYLTARYNIGPFSTSFPSLENQFVSGSRLLFGKIAEDKVWFGVVGALTPGGTFRNITVREDADGVSSSHDDEEDVFLKVFDADAVVSAGAFIEGTNTYLYYLPDLLSLPAGVDDLDFLRTSDLDPLSISTESLALEAVEEFFNTSTDTWNSLYPQVAPSDGTNDLGFIFAMYSQPRVKGHHTLSADLTAGGYQPVVGNSITELFSLKRMTNVHHQFGSSRSNIGSALWSNNSNVEVPWGAPVGYTGTDLEGQHHRRFETKYQLSVNFNASSKTLSVGQTTTPDELISESGLSRATLDTGLDEGPMGIGSIVGEGDNATVSQPRTVKLYGPAGLETLGTGASMRARNPAAGIPNSGIVTGGGIGNRISFVLTTSAEEQFTQLDMQSFHAEVSEISTILSSNEDRIRVLDICKPYDLIIVQRDPGAVLSRYFEVWRGGSLIYTSPAFGNVGTDDSAHDIDPIPRQPRLSTLDVLTENFHIDEINLNFLDFSGTAKYDYLPGWNGAIFLSESLESSVRFSARPPATNSVLTPTLSGDNTPFTVITHLTKQADLCILSWEAGFNRASEPTVVFNNFASDKLIEFFQNDPLRPMYGSYVLS